MVESIGLALDFEEKLILFRKYGVKRYNSETGEVEFFEPKPEAPALNPKELAEALADSMPPDSAMLFASAEDIPIQSDEKDKHD